MREAAGLESAKDPSYVRGGRRREPWKQIEAAVKVVVDGEVVDLGTELDRRVCRRVDQSLMDARVFDGNDGFILHNTRKRLLRALQENAYHLRVQSLEGVV